MNEKNRAVVFFHDVYGYGIFINWNYCMYRKVCKNIYEYHRKTWFGVSWALTSPWLSDAWIIHTTTMSTNQIKFEQNVLVFFIGWEKVKGFMHIWLKTSRPTGEDRKKLIGITCRGNRQGEKIYLHSTTIPFIHNGKRRYLIIADIILHNKAYTAEIMAGSLNGSTTPQ